MPKITRHGGASYEGHVDVSPADVAQPAWAVAEPVADEPAAELVVEPERPPLNASTEAWATYAVALGHDHDFAGSLTRSELIELVDTRDTAVDAGHAAGSGVAADPA